LGCRQVLADGSDKPKVRRNVPNLGGSSVTLGSLYDGRLDTLMTPLNLWSPEVIESNKIETNVGYSNTDFYTDEDILKRLDIMGVEAEMKLSFMGGLIKVAGGAKYLHDQDLDENTVRSTLAYKATTKSEVLPYGTPVTYPRVCQEVTSEATDDMTPTHVVTEIVYGLNGYMVFKKDFKSNTEKKEISGHLNVVVKAIPQFQVNGSASFNLTEEEDEISKTMSLTFYGDVLLNPPPSTFEDAIAVYKELPAKAMENQKVVSYTLTPITLYCNEQESILNGINQQNVELVSSMQADFESIERKIHGLSNSFVALSFPHFSSVLNAFHTKFSEFKNGLNKELQTLLPQIRGGGAAQTKLTELVNRYSQGVYEKSRVDVFLSVRTKEIETINNVLDIVKDTSIVVDDGRSGNGNKCLQDHEVALIYTLRVLPEVSEADKYEYASGNNWNETNKWFFDKLEVGKTGQVKRLFKQFYDDNKDASLCFMISLVLDLETDTAPAQLSVLKNGEDIITDYIPPPKVSTVTSQERGWNNHKFTIQWPANEFVTKVETKFRDLSNGDKKNQAIKLEQAIETGSETAVISLDDLKPYTTYGIVFVLWSLAGRGPESEEFEIQTLSTSTPAHLSINILASNNLGVSWSRPFEIPHGININGYEWKIRKDGIYTIFSGLKLDGDISAEVKGLEAAEGYDFLVRALPKDTSVTVPDHPNSSIPIKNMWSSVEFMTSPDKLTGIQILSRAQNDISLRWNRYQKIAYNANFLHYEIHLTSTLGEVLIRTAQKEHTVISGLNAGTKYNVEVKTVTTRGDSPFSNVVEVATKDLDVSSLDEMKNAIGLPDIREQLENTVNADMNQCTSEIEDTSVYVDLLNHNVRSASIIKTLYFDAFGTNSYSKSAPGTKITYTSFGAKSPENGMDLRTGVFTAPVTGTYFFTFNALKCSDEANGPTDVQIIVDGHVATDTEGQHPMEDNMASIGTGTGRNVYSTGPLPMSAIAKMYQGKKAWVQFMHGGCITSWEDRVTHFIGFLIST